MRRLASEIIRELEARVARLERQASSNRYADPFLAELQADIDAGMIIADDLLQVETLSTPRKITTIQAKYAFPIKWEGLGKPGQGETCYRLHHEYGAAKTGKGSAKEKSTNKSGGMNTRRPPIQTGPLPVKYQKQLISDGK